MRKILLLLITCIFFLSSFVADITSTGKAAPGEWEYIAPLPSARFNHAVVLLTNGKVLVTGGTQGGDTFLNSAAIYDPFRGNWSNISSMNYSRSGHTATLLPDGRVLVSGGKGLSGIGTADFLNNAEIYDPDTETWILLPSLMNAPRQFHTATLLPEGNVLIVAGQTSSIMVTDSAEIFNPITETFTSVGSLPVGARRDHTATRLPDGKVLIAGGQTGITSPFTYTNTTAIFDPKLNTFSSGVAFTGTRGSHTATLLNNGKVLITGGKYYSIIDGTMYRNDVQAYDPITNSWSTLASLPTARSNHRASLLPNGNILISGGTNGTALMDSRVYDTDANSWSEEKSYKMARYHHTVLLLPSGSLIAIGGYDGSSAIASVERFDPPNGFASTGASRYYNKTAETATVLPDGRVLLTGIREGDQTSNLTEIYDPSSNTFSPHTPMNQRREWHTATLLPDGKVLVAGGNTNFPANTALSSAEIYDPTTETWVNVASMNIPRRFHSATLLSDGRVLVACGDNNASSDTFLDSSEIYDPRTNTWTLAGSLSQPRREQKTVLLMDGRVMIAGGYQKSGSNSIQAIRNVDLFDPHSNLWTEGQPLSKIDPNHDVGKMGFTLNLLPDGRVLVTGGSAGIFYTDMMELYNPETGNWSTIGTLPTKRAGHTAILLGDGRLLISGGLYKITDGPTQTTYYCKEHLIFDPATLSVHLASSMLEDRSNHKAVLLPNGRIFLFGFSTSEMYTSGIGFETANRPVITSVSSVQLGQPINITGDQFFGRGYTEASSGGTQSTSSGHPLLLLYSLENEQVKWVQTDSGKGFSPTSFISQPISDFPVGPAYAIVFTNGIPSDPYFITVKGEEFTVFLPLLTR
jgi:N-acetylneuraminic acid mutarotase